MSEKLPRNVDEFRVAQSVPRCRGFLTLEEDLKAKTKRKLKYDMIRMATLNMGKKGEDHNIILKVYSDNRAMARECSTNGTPLPSHRLP